MSKHHETVRAFIEANFYVPSGERLSDDASLIDRGIVDSTGVLEVTAFLESHYGITIADDEIVPENLDSIANIVAFVKRKTGEPTNASAVAHAARTGT